VVLWRESRLVVEEEDRLTATALALIPLLPQVGPTELIIILTIVLFLFGAKKIPELARGLGTGIREFKRGTSGEAEKDKVGDRVEKKELVQGVTDQNEKVSESRLQLDGCKAEIVSTEEEDKEYSRLLMKGRPK